MNNALKLICNYVDCALYFSMMFAFKADLWFVDPLNPHERSRQDNWPVGLKNVGNTCWFSAVIQSLFQLPAFRRLVLNYEAPDVVEEGDKQRNISFMCELRKLFALLLASRRRYVDPSAAVDILSAAFSTGAGKYCLLNIQKLCCMQPTTFIVS